MDTRIFETRSYGHEILKLPTRADDQNLPRVPTVSNLTSLLELHTVLQGVWGTFHVGGEGINLGTGRCAHRKGASNRVRDGQRAHDLTQNLLRST